MGCAISLVNGNKHFFEHNVVQYKIKYQSILQVIRVLFQETKSQVCKIVGYIYTCITHACARAFMHTLQITKWLTPSTVAFPVRSFHLHAMQKQTSDNFSYFRFTLQHLSLSSSPLQTYFLDRTSHSNKDTNYLVMVTCEKYSRVSSHWPIL